MTDLMKICSQINEINAIQKFINISKLLET